ncbi:MAG: hypothetical protein OWR62_14025 [Sulfobacillus thermotolerans]|nr:hypothetical protein [Sulfobacillus thermotolerans]
MTLSSKVIKAGHIRHGDEPVQLGSAVDVKWVSSMDGTMHEAMNAAEEIIERAKAEAQAILDEAREERQQIHQAAHAEGYQAGHAEGVVAGKQAAHKEWLKIQEAVQGVLERTQRLQHYADRLEPEVVLAQAAALSAKFFSQQARENPQALKEYLTALLGTVGDDEVVLFVSPSFKATVESLAKEWAGPWQQVRVAVDRELDALECRVQGEPGGQSFLAGPITTLTAVLDEVLYGDYHED